MPADARVEAALAEGLNTLRSHGHFCDVSVQDFRRWFRAETPYPDITMEDVVRNPFLVVHEIVEIDEVKKNGLGLEKDVIINNLERVDRAHLKAAKIEIDVALAARNRKHISERLKDIRAWSKDPLTGPEMRREYSELANRAARSLAKLKK